MRSPRRRPFSLLLTGSALLCTSLLFSCGFGGVPAATLAPDRTLISSKATQIAHRQDGTVTVNGQPFFPLGFYHVSWADGGTPAQRLSDLKKFSAAGFNLMATEPIDDRDVKNYTRFLKEAQQQGVYVVSYGLSPKMVAATKGYPAVLGFKVADDSNVSVSPAEISKRTQAIKRVTPDKLTYISLSVGYNRPETSYFGVSDMVGNQSYPIGNDDINVTYPVMRSVVDSALARNTVPLANLQTFSWGQGQPAPSPDELRNMTYQALMAGVKGIVYYAYRSKEADLNHQPALWQAAQDLAHEIALLSPALLNSQRSEVSDGRAGRPIVVQLQGCGGRYLLAANNSRTAWQSMDLRLTLRPTKFHSVSGRPGALQASAARITGKLAPLEVAVYQMGDSQMGDGQMGDGARCKRES
ncbi:hypothetical protein [Deinococcus frigens]|uniref:hypothetical protein n=1 Tax=Deinococcus frigens TaxID=249403 RepID=UPI00049521FE|nr:hypothetical protein [Deinococcus frigens]